MKKIACAAALAAALSAAPAEAGKVQSAERLIRRCVNHHRLATGLEPLTASPSLGRAARLHARNMMRWRFFDHTDPLGREPWDRVALFDETGVFDGVGENIGAGYRSVRAACDGWMRSDGHRENILGDYTHMGGGFAFGGAWGRYYVQVFASLAEPEPWEEEPPYE